MHENRHFPSYRKRRHYAENHVHICARRHSGESLQNGQQPQGNRLGKNSISNLQGRSSDAIVSSWVFVYFLLVISRALLGAWRFSLFRSVYSSFHNRLDLIREPAFYWVFYLFSQFILVCFITCKNQTVLFVLVQQTSDFVPSLGQGLGLGQLPVLAIHCFFSWLALLFLELYRYLRCTSEGGSLDV